MFSPNKDHNQHPLSHDNIEVIIPHFKKRLSGVTTSVNQLIPLQRRMGLSIKGIGFGLNKEILLLSWKDILSLWRKPKKYPFRIWHARRNDELLCGIFLRDILRMKIRIVFTFATQKAPDNYKNWLLKKADRIIATSKKNSQYLKMPHVVIHHGIDLDKFSPNKAQKDVPPYIIGYVGRIRPSKGTDIFVDTMLSILPKHKSWKALIIGKTTKPHRNFLEKLKLKISEKGLNDRIIFLEEMPKIADYYQKFSLFVSPSLSEGFGLVALEAMASAVPIIVSDVGAFPNMVKEGENGFLIKNNSASSFIKVLTSLLDNHSKLKEMGLKSREIAEKNFSILKEADQIHELYQDLWKKG